MGGMSTHVSQGEHYINRNLLWIGAKKKTLLTLTLIRHRGVFTRGKCATAPGITVSVPILGQLPSGAQHVPWGSRNQLAFQKNGPTRRFDWQFRYFFRDSFFSANNCIFIKFLTRVNGLTRFPLLLLTIQRNHAQRDCLGSIR